MKKIIILVSVFVLVALGLFLIFNGNNSSTNQELTLPNSGEVQEEVVEEEEETVVETGYPICADTTCDMEGLCQRRKHAPELKLISERSQCQ